MITYIWWLATLLHIGSEVTDKSPGSDMTFVTRWMSLGGVHYQVWTRGDPGQLIRVNGMPEEQLLSRSEIFSWWECWDGGNRLKGEFRSGQYDNQTGTFRIIISSVRPARYREKAGSSFHSLTRESEPEEQRIEMQTTQQLLESLRM